MTQPVNKPADKDSLARFDSVLRAYKSRAGAKPEPPADLDARILAMAAQPVRKSLVEALGTQSPSTVAAARPRVRRTPTWISWAAGAGALVLSGGVLRVMLQENPNPQSVQVEQAKPAEIAQADVPAAAASAPIPLMEVPQAAPAAIPEATSEFANKASPPSPAVAAPSRPRADAAKDLANAPPAATTAEEALDEIQVTGSRIARAPQNSAQAMPALEAIVEAPVAEPAAESTAAASQAGSATDTQPYAAKMAQPLEGAIARADSEKAADKSTAISESDAAAMNAAPAPSARSAESAELSAPETIPEITPDRREAAKKALDPEALQRAFAKLRKLQREGKLAELKLEIQQFRVNFPRDTEIPADLKAAFDANPDLPR